MAVKVESVWCNCCKATTPVEYDSWDNITDIVCGTCKYIVATIHHPEPPTLTEAVANMIAALDNVSKNKVTIRIAN